jgi:hypothetical protein
VSTGSTKAQPRNNLLSRRLGAAHRERSWNAPCGGSRKSRWSQISNRSGSKLFSHKIPANLDAFPRRKAVLKTGLMVLRSGGAALLAPRGRLTAAVNLVDSASDPLEVQELLVVGLGRRAPGWGKLLPAGAGGCRRCQWMPVDASGCQRMPAGAGVCHAHMACSHSK